MEIVDPDPRSRKVLEGPRCPCACGGEGFLELEACPGCHRVILVCDELGTSFCDRHDRRKQGPSIHEAGTVCPGCGQIALVSFLHATEEEMLDAGFRREEVASLDGPY
jgi:hypothetical protein